MPESVVYLAYNEQGELLYIGSTGNLPQRQATHRATSPWWPEVARWEVEQVPWRSHAYQRETDLIHELRPRYNRPPGPAPGFTRQVPQTPEQAAIDARVAQLHNAGRSWAEIVHELRLSHQSLAARIRRLARAGTITRRNPGNDAWKKRWQK